MNIPKYKGIGVYSIKNLNNGKMFIGFSGKIRYRAQQHLYGLRNGYHQNKNMQQDYNLGHAFEFHIEKKFEGANRPYLEEAAKIHAYNLVQDRNTIKNGYNGFTKPINGFLTKALAKNKENGRN